MSRIRRCDVLLKDKWVRNAEPTCVLCNGCRNWIALCADPKRPYELNNWLLHRGKCPQITGLLNKHATSEGKRVIGTPEQNPSWKTNLEVKECSWTDDEKRKLDENLLAWARWEVDYGNGFICSTRCTRTTTNMDAICDACRELASDDALKHAIRRCGRKQKVKESQLPTKEQHLIHLAREKHAPHTLQQTDACALQKQIHNANVFKIFQKLEHASLASSFLELYKLVNAGKLTNHKTLTKLCDVFVNHYQQTNSDNPNLKFVIRYPETYLNFMILMHSYGGNSSRQYAILGSQLATPSPRHICALVSSSKDALQNPDLTFENMVRVRRLMDSVRYNGPVAVAGDCTKLRPQLSYSVDFSGHIIGSTLPLSDCAVDDISDIDEIITNIHKAKAQAMQVRAILVKIPLPQYPPQIIALLPMTGDDNSTDIHAKLMEVIQIVRAQLNIPVISAAADGAASELLSQNLMDQEGSSSKPFILRAPVFKTGPLTCRNQPQHGTHTASLGIGYLVNKSLLSLQATGSAGLVKHDVEDVDKQDDGAARRMFHAKGFSSSYKFVEHFFGLARMLVPDFAYAELVKMVQHVMVRQRLLLSGQFKPQENLSKLSAVGYIFDVDDLATPLSPDQFKIATVKLSTGEVNQLVEMAFKEANQICTEILQIPIPGEPDDSHPISLTPLGAPSPCTSFKKAKDDNASQHGGVGDGELTDLDLEGSSDDDEEPDKDNIPAISGPPALCEDLDVATLLQVDEGEVLQRGHSSSSPASPFAVHMDPSPLPPPTNLKLPSTPLITSHVLNAAGQVSIVKMIETRQRFQSGTNTKSELVIRLNPKFALRHVHDTEEKEKDGVTADVQDERDQVKEKSKIKPSEASHYVRIRQALDTSSQTKPKKTRELQWQLAAKMLEKALPAVDPWPLLFISSCLFAYAGSKSSRRLRPPGRVSAQCLL
ncbi:hypothetical protein BU15DRAFT_90744 [Melanogaster broomeanus]|nr:hypothetical protein BU15DRAFT_90744 [Melanogaster broomeanus]